MIDKDLQQYFAQAWQGDTYIKPLSEISKPDNKKPPLVDRHEKIYCFDCISEKLYEKDKPCSVDGLFFYKNKAYFVEFKTGFKKKITRKNYNEEKAMCPENKHPCKFYRDLFFKNQDKETEELKTSIKFKAIESYITLEKQILPCCQEGGKCELVLLVVVDVEAIEDYENILSELGEEHTPSKTNNSNEIDSISNALNNYRRKKDKHSPSNDYYYDKIQVMSADEFKRHFDDLLIDGISPTVDEHQPA